MLGPQLARPLCRSCRSRLFSFLQVDFGTQSTALHGPSRGSKHVTSHVANRYIHATRLRKNDSPLHRDREPLLEEHDTPASLKDLEAAAHEARSEYGGDILPDTMDEQIIATYTRLFGAPTLISEKELFVRTIRERFGDQLPEHWLNEEELGIFTELYGPPTIVPEARFNEVFGMSFKKLSEIDADISNDLTQSKNTLLAQQVDGTLEEIDYSHHESLDPQVDPISEGEIYEQDNLDSSSSDILKSEVMEDPHRTVAEQYLDDLHEKEESETFVRAHPNTSKGKFAIPHWTIFIPKETFVDPIASILKGYSSKQLTEITKETFGSPLLPHSVATPKSRGPIPQRPVALQASQPKMKMMQSNAFLAAMFPGLYASIRSVLVETRKRLPAAWLRGLINKEGGVQVLDAGGGGAGLLAFRDVLKAEWEVMSSEEGNGPAPLGKGTVVTGSYELRANVSQLLENTTFIPRLPDYVPARDLPGGREYNPSARKTYDIVIAPHTLWPLEEDYMRKYQTQNLWSLVNPDGGILVLLEKGIPRGFEIVAGARRMLLEDHISSPGEDAHHRKDFTLHPNEKKTVKEPGMIVAPCTNHGICPMYRIPGEMVARKHFCAFNQRYIRPEFLQRILGEKDRNHEDISFSYIVVQRGRDLRQERNFTQNEEATLSALQGYEHLKGKNLEPLTLPRAILPPIKRHKHVLLDVCTPSAQIERWTVTPSKSKQGYRDARKASWGDLWALGAKTREIREVKSGRPKKNSKETIEAVANRDTEEVYLRKVDAYPGRKQRDGRKGRPHKKELRIAEEDL